MEAETLRFRRQLVRGRKAASVVDLLERQHIRKTQPTAGADLAMLDLTALDQLDHERPRHVQQIQFRAAPST